MVDTAEDDISFLRSMPEGKHLVFSVPKFDIEATWSNSGQIVSAPEKAPAPERLKDYLQVSANAYLPILLSSGRQIPRV